VEADITSGIVQTAYFSYYHAGTITLSTSLLSSVVREPTSLSPPHLTKIHNDLTNNILIEHTDVVLTIPTLSFRGLEFDSRSEHQLPLQGYFIIFLNFNHKNPGTAYLVTSLPSRFCRYILHGA